MIRECLRSLVPQLATGDEIIVVDNGSADRSVEYACEVAQNSKLIRHTSNKGVAVGRQSGVDAALGDMILFLDDDAVLKVGALQALKVALDDDIEIGVVGPAIVDANAQRLPSARKFPTVLGKLGVIVPWSVLASIERSEREAYLTLASVADVQYVIGACQLVRTSALASIGGLDTAFFYGPEDVDMCLRFWKNRYRCVYLPSAVAIHKPRRLSRASPLGPVARRHSLALLRFFLKHRYAVRPPAFPLI